MQMVILNAFIWWKFHHEMHCVCNLSLLKQHNGIQTRHTSILLSQLMSRYCNSAIALHKGNIHELVYHDSPSTCKKKSFILFHLLVLEYSSQLCINLHLPYKPYISHNKWQVHNLLLQLQFRLHCSCWMFQAL